MLRRPSNYRDRLDIVIPSDTFCSHKIPDSFYGIHGLQLHGKESLAVDKRIKERELVQVFSQHGENFSII